MLPRYGLTAGAIIASVMMVANRALYTPWLLTRELDANYFGFLSGVNLPLIAAIPVGAALFALKRVVPGNNWLQLISAGAVTLLIYLPFAWNFLQKDHRLLFFSKLRFYRERLGVLFGV